VPPDPTWGQRASGGDERRIAEGLCPANPDLGQRLPTGADAWRYLPAGDVASPGCAHVAAQPPESPECSSARPELDSELYRE